MSQFIRLAELQIDPAQVERYKTLLAEEITASIALEPGVLALHAVTLRSAPTQFRILEIYASEEAYQAHIQTPHFLKYKTATASMVEELTLLDVDAVVSAA